MLKFQLIQDRIQFLRALTGLKRMDFCKIHGISEVSLRQIEHGKFKFPREASIDRLVRAFQKEGLYCTESLFNRKFREGRVKLKNVGVITISLLEDGEGHEKK